MKSIYQMELEDKFNRKIKYREKKLKNQRMIIGKQQVEIERLNNISNELEKWLVEWREMLDCPDFYEEGIIDCINDTLTKLQELKGDGSNEL